MTAGTTGPASRPSTFARWTIAVAGLATVALGAWGALSWSLIPVAIDGRITAVGYQSDTGLRWRVIGLSNGGDRVVDGALLGDRRHLVGKGIEKRRFSSTVTIGSRRTPLVVSPVSWKVIAVLSLFAAFAAARTRARPPWSGISSYCNQIWNKRLRSRD